MQTIKAYCSGEAENIEVVNLRQIAEIMQQFKVLYNNAKEEAKFARPAHGDGGEHDADGHEGGAANAGMLSLLALLVQKYKY